MKIRDPLSNWDPALKWLFISLFVLTGVGYLLVGLIVLKGQKKWIWAEEENPYFNRAIDDSDSDYVPAVASLDQIVQAVRRDLSQ